MTLASDTLPKGALSEHARTEPPLFIIVLIFWGAFAVAIVSTALIDPQLFQKQDPDSFLRLVQVRDLLAGQGWFDLVQHRMDPPGGALLHWSRLIDAPIAGMILVGDLFGAGEALALTAWPVLLLLPMMASAALIASTLGGRKAATWTLVVCLFFIDPLVVFLPNRIDHHNAQIALTMATVAFALLIRTGIRFGFLAGLTSAVTLAIGLEMLPYVAVIGVFIALQWAVTGRAGLPVAAYGVTLAFAPMLLFLLTASSAATEACDSLSYPYLVPVALAGLGLAGASLADGGRVVRLVTLACVGAAAAGVFLSVWPQCLSGPYGMLTPELKAVWLRTVVEAQPFQMFAAREPIAGFASLAPLAVGLVIAVAHLARRSPIERGAWALPTVLCIMAMALSFYQIRTLPFASAIVIPILATWIAEMRAQALVKSNSPVMRAWPVALAFLLANPVTYILIGIPAVDAISSLSDGRIAPGIRPKPPEDLVEGLSTAERNCFDKSSERLFAEVPPGLVMAPLFYGPTVLMLSAHDVVGGPYHRNGQAILDTVNVTHKPSDEARKIIDARGVDYVAACAASLESAVAVNRGPDGLIADVLAGKAPEWLEPVPPEEATALRLWRVKK